MRVIGWGKSDVGRKREHNEDSFFVDQKSQVFLVADGMGGHAGGEMASRIAVELVGRELSGEFSRLDHPKPHAALRIVRAVEHACEAIYHVSQEYPALEGMGTTFTGVLVEDDHVHVAHVGDSRAYLFRHGEVFQLSRDHSLVHEQLAAGQITEEEAKTSPYRHVITRSVGFEPEVEVDSLSVPLLEGDTLMLCSDGLANFVESFSEIAAVLSNTPFPEVPTRFINIANDRGGDDNITVVFVFFG
jgi:serine/threonine protein phosphatase PrpC